MAHLALAGSRLVNGVHFDEHPEILPLFDDDSVAVLFPGDGARPLEEWRRAPPRTLVTLDGTWPQAKKLLSENPRLASLPRLSFQPAAPGEYRIRKEPAAHCLATVEALSAVLGELEGDRDRYAAMLQPFRYMVERQLTATADLRAGRRPRRPKRRPSRSLVELTPIARAQQRAVLLYGEANCHPREQRAPGAPELLHLVACRPASGDRFEAVLRPRRPLSPTAPRHLGLSKDALLRGERAADAIARFRDFLGDDAVLCTWGPYARDLLVQEGEPRRGFLDLRALTARVLEGSTGGLAKGAQRLAGSAPDDGAPRAMRMLACLQEVLAALLARIEMNP